MTTSIRTCASAPRTIDVSAKAAGRWLWGFASAGILVLGLAAPAKTNEPAVAPEMPAATPLNAVEPDRAAEATKSERRSASTSASAVNRSDAPAVPPSSSERQSPGTDGQSPSSVGTTPPESSDQPDTPRSWFELYGLDESHFAKFVSGRPLDADEVEPLLKVIFRMRRFTPEQMARWIRGDWSPEELTERPQMHQSGMFRLVGRAIDVEPIKPSEEVASLFEIPEYYRCRIELPSGAKAEVYAASVPHAWIAGSGNLPARCEAAGVFLKTLPAADRPELAFAAARIAWFPATPLGDLDFDHGLFDQVVDRDPPERDPFHELLAAVRRSKPGELDRIAREQLRQWADRQSGKAAPGEGQGAIILRASDGSWFYSVVPLFHDAAASRGRLVTLDGIARQVQKVVIDEPEIRQRYGIDHYYQVSLFTADSGVNPVIFCVLELPEGMPVGTRDRYGEKVRVSGFMFKLWSYRIDIPRGADEDSKTGRMRQRAPLLIARDLTWFPAPPPPPRSSLAAVIGLGFLAAASALGWWAIRRSDRRAAKPRRGEAVVRFQLPTVVADEPSATPTQNDSPDTSPPDPPPPPSRSEEAPQDPPGNRS